MSVWKLRKLINFTSATVLEQSPSSEILSYTLTQTRENASGYYTFIFPFTCELQPLLYVGSHATDIDTGLVQKWLAESGGVSQSCQVLELNVSILGFSNTSYNRLSISYNSTTTATTTLPVTNN